MANCFISFLPLFYSNNLDYDIATLNEVLRPSNNNWTLAKGLAELQAAGGVKAISTKTVDEIKSLYNSLLNINKAPVIENISTETYTIGFQRAIRSIVKKYTITSGTKTIVAYHINVDAGQGKVIFNINGHFGDYPSKLSMGLTGLGGYAEAKILARIAPMGYEIITYDDSYNTAGLSESSYTILPKDTILHTLEDTMIVEKALLLNFDKIYGMGLSGGAQRMYHYLINSRANLKKAYIAGYFAPAWTAQDPDVVTTDKRYETSGIELAHLVQVGVSKGINIRLCRNHYESGLHNYSLQQMRTYLEGLGINISYGGDDPTGVGAGGRVHEYYIKDLIEFLET
jgi:hypothetical protein